MSPSSPMRPPFVSSSSLRRRRRRRRLQQPSWMIGVSTTGRQMTPPPDAGRRRRPRGRRARMGRRAAPPFSPKSGGGSSATVQTFAPPGRLLGRGTRGRSRGLPPRIGAARSAATFSQTVSVTARELAILPSDDENDRGLEAAHRAGVSRAAAVAIVLRGRRRDSSLLSIALSTCSLSSECDEYTDRRPASKAMSICMDVPRATRSTADDRDTLDAVHNVLDVAVTVLQDELYAPKNLLTFADSPPIVFIALFRRTLRPCVAATVVCPGDDYIYCRPASEYKPSTAITTHSLRQ
ncbi:hypothetical protein BD626DRAFT_573549 [Schizophyllum amplum]|uniref:Uncharacterized protein n=1 Tax=Schizophyllum amplum TaxID=97359 RepID=A0A550C166_9AGAR|nr:hypothetical protein BD626DRAFT_573549 [Auriculariopsis ampla]